MNRLSLALFPHKGIRNIFSMVLVSAGSIDYSNKEKVSGLFDTCTFFFELLETHSKDENTFMLSELEKKVPGSSAHDMAEHEEIEAEQLKLEKMLDEIYSMSQAGENPDALGFKFYFELSRFQSLYFMHMIGEETETQNLLWENFTDDELISMRARIISKMEPDFLLTWTKYLIPALTPSERNQILGGMKANAPAEFFEKIMSVAEKNLPTEDYKTLLNNLN
jgi:hypothetical protein